MTCCGAWDWTGRPSAAPHFSREANASASGARALVGEPAAVLLDEPLSNVDVMLRQELIALLRELLNERRLAVLLVTHDLREAGAVANRVAVLEAGRLVQVGTIPELQARPATKFVEALLADRG